MSPQYPYALYLDSKILGTARQLISFYEQGVFSAENTIIYLKKYKESAKGFIKIFRAKGIPFQFMKPKELDALSGQTIFYAFNAQSNCRFVANRKLTHIFITHGESNKVSSIKPIIRIYDHVVMAGKLSLERYYRSGLFDDHDYETGRLIMMGDTFIGRTEFSSDASWRNVLFYAPTWEGGLESENYSSLVNTELVYQSLVNVAKELKLKTIIVQPHPNLGHRLSAYRQKIVNILCRLSRENGYEVLFKSNNITFSLINRLRLKIAKVKNIEDCSNFYAKHAFIDISAMESQCVNENINYNIFYSKFLLRVDMVKEYVDLYGEIGVSLDDSSYSFIHTKNNYEIGTNLCSFSNPDWAGLTGNERIKSLVEYINEK